jgi:hypothetical protein
LDVQRKTRFKKSWSEALHREELNKSDNREEEEE